MTFDRVMTTKNGRVRFGTLSSFETLGRVEKSEMGWVAYIYLPEIEVEESMSLLGIYRTRREAVSAIVERSYL